MHLLGLEHAVIHRRQALKLLGLGLLSLNTVGISRSWASMTGLTPAEARELVKGSRVMMGNIPVTISVAASGRRDQATKAIAAAFEEIQRLEGLLSLYNSASEVSRINRAAGQRPTSVSFETWEVISRGLEFGRLTNGAFSPVLGAASQRWSFLDKKHVLTPAEVAELKPESHLEDLVLDENRQTVWLRKPGMKVDLGGIAKGYIAERAKAVLLEHGVTSGIVATAGDLVIFGAKPDGKPWRVGVQHPRKPGYTMASMELTDCAISTSGDYERFFTEDGVIYHHILDPETLFPARECQSVTVVADHGLFADALSTGAFVMGSERGMALLHRTGLGKTIIIDGRGGVSVSPELESRVRFGDES
ncbi:MAG: FAD:protein FMN transferase [Nitrospirota bacterium]